MSTIAKLDTTKNVSGVTVTLSTLPNGDTDLLRYSEASNGSLVSITPPHQLAEGTTWLLYNKGESTIEANAFIDTYSSTPAGIAVGKTCNSIRWFSFGYSFCC